jgi:hypothetical protein
LHLKPLSLSQALNSMIVHGVQTKQKKFTIYQSKFHVHQLLT